MPDPLEYVINGAWMLCDKGAVPGTLTATSNVTEAKVSNLVASIEGDRITGVNIPSFGICSITKKPCTAAPTGWKDTYPAKIDGQETLIFESKLTCAIGGEGCIKFLTSGQVPIPPEAMEEIMDEFGEKPGWGWWDTAELVPFAGSAIGIVREAAKGNGWMALANVGFLAMDIGGLFTGGATTAASTAAKGALKAGMKAAQKAVAKVGGKVFKKGMAKAGGKAISKKADSIVAKNVKNGEKKPATACFPAGTPIAVKDGHKNIEDIKVGDLVWAYNEATGENDLKPVVETMQNEVDTTVKITLGEDVIESTIEHPFYTRKGWKDVGDLTTQDELKTKEGKWEQIKALKYLFDKKKVYNFEVADLHTYFVGVWEWVVHNGKKDCKGKKSVKQGTKEVLKGKEKVAQAYKKYRKEGWEVVEKSDTKRILKNPETGEKIIFRKSSSGDYGSFDSITKPLGNGKNHTILYK